jgi:hypothetical protein
MVNDDNLDMIFEKDNNVLMIVAFENDKQIVDVVIFSFVLENIVKK